MSNVKLSGHDTWRGILSLHIQIRKSSRTQGCKGEKWRCRREVWTCFWESFSFQCTLLPLHGWGKRPDWEGGESKPKKTRTHPFPHLSALSQKEPRRSVQTWSQIWEREWMCVWKNNEPSAWQCVCLCVRFCLFSLRPRQQRRALEPALHPASALKINPVCNLRCHELSKQTPGRKPPPKDDFIIVWIQPPSPPPTD